MSMHLRKVNNVYGNFIKSEMKKWSSDPMMSFMVIYPILFGFIGRYLLPWLAERNNFNLIPYNDLILVILTLFVPVAYGALIGFSILQDRDDFVLTSIRVSPLGIHKFLLFRLIMVYIFCFIASLYVMWFSNTGYISFKNMIAISFLASLESTVSGLLINLFSKIEVLIIIK